MAQQAVVGQRDPAQQQRVDLRVTHLVGEVDGNQQRGRRQQRAAVIPEPARQVINQRQRPKAGGQRRQHEGHAPATGEQEGQRLQPHEYGRLVRVQLVAAMREQPLAVFDHQPRDQGEARFVRWPWIAQTDAHTQQQQCEHAEQQQLPAGTA